MSVGTAHTTVAPRSTVPHLVAARPSAAVAEPVPDGTAIGAAVEQAVAAMRADLFCGAGIADIATRSFYSKFHFTREFSRLVGTTPRRFLAALRMERASRILLTTTLSIADAGTMVGYSSVGTFSTRFAALVGMSPRQWRACGGRPAALETVQGSGAGQVRAHVEVGGTPGTAECDLFVGVFEDSIVQGPPVAAARVDGPGPVQLVGVPEGDWTVVVLGRVRHDLPAGDAHVEWLRATAPVTVHGPDGPSLLPVRMRLRGHRPTDPPVLLGGTHADPAAQPEAQRNREYPLDMVFQQR